MKKWLLRILYSALVLLPVGAIADYTATTGTGATVFSFVCSVSKICPAFVLIDSTNVEKATAGNPLRTDPTGTTTQPVSAASLPLPTGAATAAAQTTAQTSLSSIDTKTPSLGQALAATSVPVILPAATVTTLTPPTAVTVNPTTAANWGLGSFGSAMPASGQGIGLWDGANMVHAKGDETSGLWVNIKAGAGSGGTALADEAAFTQGTTSITPVGCFFTSGTYTALTTLHAGILQCTSDGASFNNVYKWAGTALGAPSAYGTSPGAVNVPGVNAYVTNATPGIANNADAIAPVTASASSPVPVNNYGYVFNGTTFDRMRSATQTGSVAIGSSDPCLGANKTNLPISQSGTSSVQLVALSGATTIYVCSLSLIAAGATTVVLTTGTGSACVTGNAAVIGDTTANIANGLSLAANGGLTLGNGAGTIAKGASSSELCMTLGTNVRMSGNLTYVQQ